MLNTDERLEPFYRRCRTLGLKVTPQRVQVYLALVSELDHPTADDVYQCVRQKLPHISYDTVNRTLLSFAEHGIIKLVESRGSAKRFDPEIEKHHHFQCVKCNRIIDFQYGPYDRIKPPAGFRPGLVVLDQKVVLEGICDRCRKIKMKNEG